MDQTLADYQNRVDAVEARIAAACERAGRAREDVELVAVSKTFPPEAVRGASECGLAVFGENRVQEAAAKIPLCRGGVAWHLIGHLQRNKARMAAPLFSVFHGIDSERLVRQLDKCCAEVGNRPRILIQVNAVDEASKSGCEPDAAAELVQVAASCSSLDVVGLMTIPPFAADTEAARPHFVALRRLRDHIQDETGVALPELSMGMSADFEIAIEEGATWIRVGSALFGSRRGKTWRPSADELM